MKKWTWITNKIIIITIKIWEKILLSKVNLIVKFMTRKTKLEIRNIRNNWLKINLKIIMFLDNKVCNKNLDLYSAEKILITSLLNFE